MTIGERLRELRYKAGLTQGEIAREIGITQQTYSNYEKNVRSMDAEMIKRFSEYYGVSADYILCIETYRQPQLSARSVNYSEESQEKTDEFVTMLKRVYESIKESESREGN